jgi:hypothetical protein
MKQFGVTSAVQGGGKRRGLGPGSYFKQLIQHRAQITRLAPNDLKIATTKWATITTAHRTAIT